MKIVFFPLCVAAALEAGYAIYTATECGGEALGREEWFGFGAQGRSLLKIVGLAR